MITAETLALACPTCSLRKGRRTEAVDPNGGTTVGLFNPRTMNWSEHFGARADGDIVGLTSIGRATRNALRLDTRSLLAIRHELHQRGLWPP